MFLDDPSFSLLRWLSCLSFECVFARRLHVHLMRVDDLRFLFKVEGLLVVLEVRLRCLVGVVLLIV